MKRYHFFAWIGAVLIAAGPLSAIRGKATAETRLDPVVAGQPTQASAPLPATVYLTARLSPFSEVTPVTSRDSFGVGEGIVALHVTQDQSGNITSASADLAVLALGLHGSDMIFSFSVNQGSAETDGPVILDSGVSPSFPARLVVGKARLYRLGREASTALARELLANPSGFYFNVATDSSPSGAIRGQLSPVSLTSTPLVFGAFPRTGGEVPVPTSADAPGFGVALVFVVPVTDSTGKITGGTAQFDVIAGGLLSTDLITGAQVQQGSSTKVSKNAPVVIDSDVTTTNPLALSSTGSATFTSAGMSVPANVLQGMIASPKGYFFNISTVLNSHGAIRDQLFQFPTITGASVQNEELVVTGYGFKKGAVILVNLEPVKTIQDTSKPTTKLIATKAGSLITVGSTVFLAVVNPDETESTGFQFVRSQ